MLKYKNYIMRAISEFISEFRVERSKSFEGKLARIFEATGTSGDSALARILGIKPPSVTAARKRQQIPTGWVELIAEKYNISADWLFFGTGPMRSGDPLPAQETTACPLDERAALEARIAELEAKLAKAHQREEAAREAERAAVRLAENATTLATRYLPPPVGVVQEPVPAYSEKGTDPARTPPPQAPHKRPDEGC